MSREPKHTKGEVLEACGLRWGQLESWRQKGFVNLDADSLVNRRKRRQARFSDSDIELLKRLKAAVDKPDVRQLARDIDRQISNEQENVQ